MKIRDIYTHLKKDINLQQFHPKNEIEADVFSCERNTLDCQDDLEKTIDSRKEKNIKVESLYFEKKSLDALSKKSIWKTELITSPHKVVSKKAATLFSSLYSFFERHKHSKIIFIIMAFILFLFIDKAIIEYNTNNGYEKLSLIQTSKKEDLPSLLVSAKRNFNIANFLFSPFKIIPHRKIHNASLIIQWWKQASIIGEDLLSFGSNIENLIQKKWVQNIMFSQLLLNNKDFFLNLEEKTNLLNETYSKIDLSWEDKQLQDTFQKLKDRIKQSHYYLHTFNNNFDTFLEILWHSKRKRYLIAFQNNDEIRAQWGFMWSLWLVDIFRWQIKNFKKDDVYFHEFRIKNESFTREKAPEGINKMTYFLWLRDANYYINHKDSWEKIKFFMEKSGSPIDGILYVNLNSFLKILSFIWEFESKVLNNTINSQNFSRIMSLLVEAKVSQEDTLWSPKQILFDFMNEFKTISNQKWVSHISILKSLLSDISNREIAFYIFNSSERNLLQSLSLFNPIQYWETLDFSYPVRTSISGNKSDRYIETSYKKDIIQWEECHYDTSLEIILTHTLDENEKQNIQTLMNQYHIPLLKQKELSFIQWNGDNKQYMRVIVPKDAIINNTNVVVTNYKDRGKSVSFYMNTPVWETSHFTIDYTIPNPNCQIYNYKFYKQPWIKKYSLEINKLWEHFEFNDMKKDVYLN